jgi:hypothetical protein
MTNLKTFIRQCLLAVALAGMALGASAGPVNFHVNVNTATLNGPGLISFYFSKLGAAGPVTAKVTNIMGDAGAVTPTGEVTVDAGGFTIANGEPLLNFADVDAAFGGQFSFDIAFSGGFMDEAGLDSSTLFLSLLGTDYGVLAGDDFGVAQFNVLPGMGIAANAAFPQFVSISAVPEPSAMLMMFTGVGLVGFTARRRKAQASR